MGSWLREQWNRRPWWMSVLMLFCIYMTLIYVPWDLFAKPVAADEEVWFGVRFHGTHAKLLEIPHWLVYAFGSVGFWHMRRWMWPWAAVYAAQVAISFAVWPHLYLDVGTQIWVASLGGGALFAVPTVALWRAKTLFQGPARPSMRERYGEWAVVTGASAGIGREFCRALAAEGFSIVLVARREERLRTLAAELEAQFGIATRSVCVDLAAAQGPGQLVDAVRDLEVGVLVNNAGFGYAGGFALQDAERLREMVSLHCVAPTLLTSALLGGMRARGHGAVVMVGSVAGCQPLPLHAVYSATKAFDNFLGEALWGEMRGSGIDVLSLLPGSTESEFHDVAGELPHAGQAASEVVAAALGALGKQPSVTTNWLDWARSNLAMRVLPRSLLAAIARDVVAGQTPKDRR